MGAVATVHPEDDCSGHSEMIQLNLKKVFCLTVSMLSGEMEYDRWRGRGYVGWFSLDNPIGQGQRHVLTLILG